MGDSTPRVILFSYGMFQLPDVQLGTFGRLVAGSDDTLQGYSVHYVDVPDTLIARSIGATVHPDIRATGDPADTVAGRALQLTESELQAADAVELPGVFARTRVSLVSGREAWAYAQP